jgi:hypothetical protein
METEEEKNNKQSDISKIPKQGKNIDLFEFEDLSSITDISFDDLMEIRHETLPEKKESKIQKAPLTIPKYKTREEIPHLNPLEDSERKKLVEDLIKRIEIEELAPLLDKIDRQNSILLHKKRFYEKCITTARIKLEALTKNKQKVMKKIKELQKRL